MALLSTASGVAGVVVSGWWFLGAMVVFPIAVFATRMESRRWTSRWREIFEIAEAGELDFAVSQLEKLGASCGHGLRRAGSVVLTAELELRRSRPDRALELLAAAWDVKKLPTGLTNLVANIAVRAHIALGDPDAARNWVNVGNSAEARRATQMLVAARADDFSGLTSGDWPQPEGEDPSHEQRLCALVQALGFHRINADQSELAVAMRALAKPAYADEYVYLMAGWPALREFVTILKWDDFEPPATRGVYR